MLCINSLISFLFTSLNYHYYRAEALRRVFCDTVISRDKILKKIRVCWVRVEAAEYESEGNGRRVGDLCEEIRCGFCGHVDKAASAAVEVHRDG